MVTTRKCDNPDCTCVTHTEDRDCCDEDCKCLDCGNYSPNPDDLPPDIPQKEKETPLPYCQSENCKCIGYDCNMNNCSCPDCDNFRPE